MATYGLTLQGFVATPLDAYKTYLENSFRSVFGPSINLNPDQPFGQMIGILAAAFASESQKQKDVYDQFYPSSARGINLDNVCSITGIIRNGATPSYGEVTLTGTLGTIIPANSVISVLNDSSITFQTDEAATIAAGTNAVQTVSFSGVPDAGAFTLVYDGEQTASIPFTAAAADVQTALNNLPSLSGVTVTGTFTLSFVVTFAGADGQQPQILMNAGANTLESSAVPVNVSVLNTTPGVLPNVSVGVTAVTPGAIPAYSGTLTVIETPVAGWTSVTNALDMTLGKDIETDAQFRIRRLETLATAGASTIDSIRARILNVQEVTSCRVFENDTDVVDGSGRPPHSFEAVVEGGANQDIGDAIWQVKAAGIATDGDINVNVLDSMGLTHVVSFSRPNDVDIYVDVEITVDSDLFPDDGEEAIKEAIANFAQTAFGIGDDVIYFELFCPIAEVAGVLTVDLNISTIDPPVGTANIAIADDEKSLFDTDNITVTVVP